MDPAAIHDLYRLLGEKLRTARLAAHLSQAEIAAHLQVCRASVVNFEAGKQHFPFHTLYAYALAVGLPARRLLLEPCDDNAQAPSLQRCCRTCLHGTGSRGRVECHRFPPSSGKPWPRLLPDQRCGEWKPQPLNHEEK